MGHYIKQTWKARVATGDNRFRDQNGTVFEFTPLPYSVSQTGTAFSATLMNHIEDGVEMANNMYDKTSDWSYSASVGTGSIIDAVHCGGWVALRVRINSSSAVSAGATFGSGQVSDTAGTNPAIVTESIGQYNGVPLLGVLDEAGNVTVTNIGTTSIASGHSVRFTFVFPVDYTE